MSKRLIILTALVASMALIAPTAATAKAAKYKGKTKEGTSISFVVEDGWVDQLDAMLPTSCVSTSGGTPGVKFTQWRIPYKFRLDRTAKVSYGDPTKHYTIKTHRASGGRIKGNLEINYSLLGSTSGGGYAIWTCLATAKFSLTQK